MRSKCDKIERLLSDYIDGTLSEKQTDTVASHLRSCRSCRQEVVDLKKTGHLLENFYVQPEASDAYYARFTTRLQQRIEQSAPPALHQRLLAAATRFGWHLRSQLHRSLDDSRISGLLSIRQHAFPYYILGLTLAMLVVTPLLLNQVSPEGNSLLGQLVTAAKVRFFHADPSPSIQPTAALTIAQESRVTEPTGIRRNVGSGRTTETPAVDSGSELWHFTDEPMTEGYIFVARRENDSETLPSVTLDIDSELLAYAELPPQGTFWARLTGREVLTESRYALLLLKGIDTGAHAHQQYERKWSGFKGFSQKLLEDVPLEKLSIPEVYASTEE